MSANRDISRVVRSWIREEEHDSADHILQVVLLRLDSTPQRRSWWPAWRSQQMNRLTQAAVAAAAVIVVAVVGYNLLPGNGSGGGVGSPSPAPSPTVAITPAPTDPPPSIPPAGALPPGRHLLTLEGVPFTFEIAEPGWTSNGSFGFDKGPIGGPNGASFIFWFDDANGVFSDPCEEVRAPIVGPSVAELASAIADMPQIELVSGPSEMSIGGRPAQQVVVRIPDDIACQPEQFYLWYDDSSPAMARYATRPSSTIRVWIIDVDGVRVQLDGETYDGAEPSLGEELDGIIDSIEFE